MDVLLRPFYLTFCPEFIGALLRFTAVEKDEEWEVWEAKRAAAARATQPPPKPPAHKASQLPDPEAPPVSTLDVSLWVYCSLG